MKVHEVPADDLHKMGQGTGQQVGNDFVHSGIPDKMVDYASMPNGLKPAGTATLRANLEKQNGDVPTSSSQSQDKVSPNGV